MYSSLTVSVIIPEQKQVDNPSGARHDSSGLRHLPGCGFSVKQLAAVCLLSEAPDKFSVKSKRLQKKADAVERVDGALAARSLREELSHAQL